MRWRLGSDPDVARETERANERDLSDIEIITALRISMFMNTIDEIVIEVGMK